MAEKKSKIIIDTDPGIDDAQAILYALAHPNLQVMGLTTIFGNVSADLATANALRLLELSGHTTVPVAQGSAVPLQIAPNPVADFVHGKNGFGEVQLPAATTVSADPRSAAQFIVDLVHAHPNEITLVPVGPLTNIAAAIALDPSIVNLVQAVVIMGGAVQVKGNVTDFAEANMWGDPHAAHAVVSAKWPQLVVLGLDVTLQVKMTMDYFDQVAVASTKCGGFIKATAVFYAEWYLKKHGFAGCCPHDLCALVYVSHPEFFEAKACSALSVITEGDKIGQTVADAEGLTDSSTPSSHFAVKVAEENLLADFLQTIKSLP